MKRSAIIVIIIILMAIMIFFTSIGRKEDVLEKAFLSESSNERSESLKALRNGNDESVRTVENGLKRKECKIRAGCASLLGEIESDNAIDLLEEALKDDNDSMKLAAVESLKEIPEPQCGIFCCKLFFHKEL